MAINMSAGKKAHPDHIIEYRLKDIDQYARVVIDILPRSGEVYVEGVMGAGKTTFIKALLRNLGVKDAISSPTFSLINTYELPNKKVVYHADLYRVRDEAELYDIGFEEYIESGSLLFIEPKSDVARNCYHFRGYAKIKNISILILYFSTHE